ncbi:hypothetical protein [Nocardiopsis alkaliphila]|uniref:hypothetical protein n=1 Tax=Nocardiopsis alkaliphila TaxID=225762 RepID=UPI00036ED0AA|nr:hypothetical protein [Nocardiopsis alkaliphila]
MLVVIAILMGAFTLGGGLAVAGAIGDRIAEDGLSAPRPPSVERALAPSPTPISTPEPAREAALEPAEGATRPPDPWSMTADEVVEGLREDHGLDTGLDISDELCGTEAEEDELFTCTMAVETDLVRVVSFDGPLIAATVVLSLLGQEEGEVESGVVDLRNACHVVLIWFEGTGMDEGGRTAMTQDVEDIVGC